MGIYKFYYYRAILKILTAGADIVMQWGKASTCNTYFTRALVQVPAALFLIPPHANGPGKQQMIAQVLGPMPPIWKTQLVAPGCDLSKPRLMKQFRELKDG